MHNRDPRPSACPCDPHCGAWSLTHQECDGDPAECESVRETRGGMVCAAVAAIAALIGAAVVGWLLWWCAGDAR